jgi:gas vesicle protein
MRNRSNFLKALVGGMALGAGTALLLAPRSGKETREQMREYGRKASSFTKKGGSSIARRIRGLRDEIESLTREAVDGGSGRVHGELEALRMAFEEGQKVLKEERARRFNGEPDLQEELLEEEDGFKAKAN